MAAKIKAVLTAGLYPNVAHVEYTPRVDSVANPERNVCMAETGHGILQLHPASINRYLMANGWLVYHEKVCVCVCVIFIKALTKVFSWHLQMLLNCDRLITT